MDNNQDVLPQQAPPVGPQVPPAPPMPPPAPQQTGSRKRIVVIVSICIVVLGIIGAAIFFYQSSSSNPQSATPTPVINNTPTIVTPIPTIEEMEAVELILEKGKKVTLPESNVTIVYVGGDISGVDCIDCVSTTELLLEDSGKEQELQYYCGGLAGTCVTKLVGFNFLVELVDATTTTATVKVLPQ